jgi:hypothetical protein
MIPQDFISEWKKAAPWPENDHVEQDLIICRALVEIFSHPDRADNLAFRGGTALFKLHLTPIPTATPQQFPYSNKISL